uniref:Uncharacterized protein n=1 Tax=Oryza sativa subsp. japonica TaxID=39947 RepID=Q7F0Z2_ORYSJ|nr:hypothetical protein [Oryza sativa Japonica Group]BAD03442.1 hypothetical protein [Oryza sativa Japonica Group]
MDLSSYCPTGKHGCFVSTEEGHQDSVPHAIPSGLLVHVATWRIRFLTACDRLVVFQVRNLAVARRPKRLQESSWPCSSVPLTPMEKQGGSSASFEWRPRKPHWSSLVSSPAIHRVKHLVTLRRCCQVAPAAPVSAFVSEQQPASSSSVT